MNWILITLTYISFLNFATFLFLTLMAIRLGIMLKTTNDRAARSMFLFYLAMAATWVHSVLVSSPVFSPAFANSFDVNAIVGLADVPFNYWYRAITLTLLAAAIFNFDYEMRRGLNE